MTEVMTDNINDEELVKRLYQRRCPMLHIGEGHPLIGDCIAKGKCCCSDRDIHKAADRLSALLSERDSAIAERDRMRSALADLVEVAGGGTGFFDKVERARAALQQEKDND